MPWIQLILQSDAEGAPRLSELLSDCGAAAVTLQDSADQPLYEPPPGATPLWNRTRVVGLFPAETDAEAVMGAVAAAIAPAPVPPWRAEALEDKDWSRAWMDEFKPMRFGERLWIVPSWHAAPDPNGVNLLLDPGLAFGTGTHPTTRLCLEWLDAHPTAGFTVVDYGCGSGVLGVAAALLGASRVIAVDNDPQALLATRDNAGRNGVSEVIATFGPEQLPELQADVVLANILAKPLVVLAERIGALVRPGGALVLSGILPEQAEEVAAAYLPRFDMAPAVESDGWVRLEGVRK